MKPAFCTDLRRPVAAVVAALLALGCAWADREAALPPRDEILNRLARVAGLYRDQALRFTCDETIYFSGWGSPQIHKFKYIYRYSDTDDTLRDYRTVRGRAGRKPADKQEKARLTGYGLPTYLQRAYSWVFVFHEQNRSRFRFEIEGSESIQGTETIRIRFVPIPPYETEINTWNGTVWIDCQSSQLVRVEAIHVDELEQYELLQRSLEVPRSESSPGAGRYTFTTVTTEFDVLKNGMRFPGRVIMNSTAHVVTVADKATAQERPVFNVTQTYKRYRFFGVRTAEQIQRIVEGN